MSRAVAPTSFPGFVAESEAMREVRELTLRLASDKKRRASPGGERNR